MPKTKKMKKEKLNIFKKLLEKKKDEILAQIQHLGNEALNKTLRESSGDLSSHTLHMADLATDNYNRDFSLDIVSNEQEVLYKINEALRRIKEGTYGFCIDCGKKISEKRLKAVPYADLCLGHQEEKEEEKK